VEAKQTFIEHLEELRKRLVISLIAVGIGFGVCYYFSQEIFRLLMMPLYNALPAGATMIFTTPAEAFFIYIKVALIAGIFAASPVVLYQIWLFVAPALYRREKGYAIPFILSSTLLFIGGAAFGYFITLPYIFKFFMGFATDFIQPAPKLKETLSFSFMLLLTFGLSFEFPLFLFFLARLGVINARQLARNRGYVIVAIFIVAAILTPPDLASQFMMAGPLVVLYEASIWVAKIFGRKPKREEQRQTTEGRRPSAEGRRPKTAGQRQKKAKKKTS
jgi:sec-independent protein translocase protein TatC